MVELLDEDLDDTLKLNIDVIRRAPTNVPTHPRGVLLDEKQLQSELDKTKRELAAALSRHSDVSTKHEELKLEHRALQVKDETSAILNNLIEPMARKSYAFMCWYCGGVGLLVIAHGLPVIPFTLAETTMNFLVGSTAATVIGLVGMVLTGVFLNARK